MMELNKIYCEDCMDTMGRMEDDFIDLTVTSPPYDNLRTYNDNIDETWDESVWKPIIKELYRVTKEGGVVVWVVGDATIDGSETGTSFRQALFAKEVGFNLHDTMIFEKPSGGAVGSNLAYWQAFEYMFVFTKGKPKTVNRIKDRKNKTVGSIKREVQKNKDVGSRMTNGSVEIQEYGYRNNIWEYHIGFANKDDSTEHEAPFPEKLVADHIKSWSNEGDLVYDPFMGSGTTAKMAHLLKRNWIGSEISQEYVDLAYKRLQPYLTQKTLF